MSFKEQYKDYKAYNSDEFYVNSVPSTFGSALEGFILRVCGCGQNIKALKAAIDLIASIIPIGPTNNWGRDFLINDLSYYTGLLVKGDFYKIMDFIEILHDKFDTTYDEVNEFLESQKIGYVLERGFSSSNWILRENVGSKIESIENTIKNVENICQQTVAHLKQAKDNILENKSDRDRKDAVRDCLSAMETLLKKITDTNDIKEATNIMRKDNAFGKTIIVKDGLSIWNHIHEEYKDIRHGNPEISVLTEEETLYWIDRIACFINYVSKIYYNI